MIISSLKSFLRSKVDSSIIWKYKMVIDEAFNSLTNSFEDSEKAAESDENNPNSDLKMDQEEHDEEECRETNEEIRSHFYHVADKQDNENVQENVENGLSQWQKFGEFVLSYNDRKIIVSDVKWLTDNIINAAQHLLHTKYPDIHGLQDVVLNEINELKEIPEDESFVQIVLNSGNHWICLSNVFSEKDSVIIYDSKCLTDQNISREVEKGIRKLMPNVKEMIYQKVSQQIDNSQCGVYAIAFAHCLCEKLDPASVLFTFQPSSLRRHLLKCFEEGDVKMFPRGDQLKAKFKRRYI